MKSARWMVSCTLTLTLSLFAATDPFVGIWKLNPERSKLPTGAPGYFFATMQIESAGTGLKSTASAADGEGIAGDLTFNCQQDGSPCKVTTSLKSQSAVAVDTITLKRVDANTILATGAMNGKPAYSDRRVVSADGKTMTVVRVGKTADGKSYKSTLVLERSH